MDDKQLLTACQLCPRQCGVNRLRDETGFCGETEQLRIASILAHFGEEPPISGEHGSGTVFFSGCTLKCDFCQNYQISQQNSGDTTDIVHVVQRLEALYMTQGIHNVNFVTPDHFLPHTIDIVTALRRHDIHLPIIYNMSGYERVESLRIIEDYADIYLPDFKYADNTLGEKLSHCQNYSSVALDALTEMITQKGFLDTFGTDRSGCIAQRGVLVRHLILPGHIRNSIHALDMLFLEFGRDLPLSLMSQYHPVAACELPELDRSITRDEFCRVYEYGLDLGFHHLFIQYPQTQQNPSPGFLPDFTQKQPFKGNIR